MQMRNGLVLCVAALAMFMMATETEASAIRRAVSRRGLDGCVRGVTNAAILGAAAAARPPLPCACPRRGGAELRFAAPWWHAGQGVRCPHSAAVFGVGRARLANTLLRCFRWCRLPAAHKAFAFPAGGNGERAAACSPGRTLSWGRLECAVSISRNSPLVLPGFASSRTTQDTDSAFLQRADGSAS